MARTGSEALGRRLGDLALQRARRLPENASVDEALALMRQVAAGAILVMDVDGALAGIFTERDVLTRVAGRTAEIAERPLSRVMTARPDVLSSQTRMTEALELVLRSGHHHIPVRCEDGDWCVLSADDVFRWARDLAGEGPEPGRRDRTGEART